MKNFKRFVNGEGAPEVEQARSTGVAGCQTVGDGWWCTRPAGHDELHAAGNGIDAIYATWEDSDDVPIVGC